MTQIFVLSGALVGTVFKPTWVLTAAGVAAILDALFSGRW